MATETIQIRHLADNRFSIDGGAATSIPSPYDTKYSQHAPDSDLMDGLQWYLEQTGGDRTPFLGAPHFEVHRILAKELLDALNGWGTQAASALFGSGAPQPRPPDRIYEIISADPQILSWPWEHLRHGGAHLPIGRASSVVRRLSASRSQGSPPAFPRDKLNILLVTCRERSTRELAWRAVSQPMLKTLKDGDFPVEITMLRPPTFRRLREVLEDHAGYFHVLHFDGHGLDDDGVGYLYFADPHGQLTDRIRGALLGELLAESQTPLVVLNACQSGKQSPASRSASSAVVTALIGAGVPAVVGMSYSLHVDAAKLFIPDFYKTLCKRGSLHEAVRQGRRSMAFWPTRRGRWGECELQDWMVPVLYQRQDVGLQFGSSGPSPWIATQRSLPALLRRDARPDLIGRDRDLLELEYATQRAPAGLIVYGPQGTGKTALVREYLEWRAATQGLRDRIIGVEASGQSLEDVLERIGAALGKDIAYDNHHLALKSNAVEKLLKTSRRLVVLDDLNLTEAEAEALNDLLRGIRRPGGSKIIVTTRAPHPALNGTDLWLRRLDPLDEVEAERLFVQIWQAKGYYPNAYRQLINHLPSGNPGFLAGVVDAALDHRPLQIQSALRAMGPHPPEAGSGELLGRLRSSLDAPPSPKRAAPGPAPSTASPPAPTTAASALSALLLSLFSARGLERFLLLDPRGGVWVASLPSAASPRELTDAIVRLLSREGLIDEALFQRLASERPHRREDIARVQQLCIPSPDP